MRRAPRHELARLRARIDVEDRLRRSLRLVDDEDQAIALGQAALRERFGDPAVLAVPEPGLLGLGGAALVDPRLASAAAVSRCAAVRSGMTVVADSSDRFDACEHLAAHRSPVSAVCVPVAAGGSVAGAVHWIGPEHEPLDPAAIAEIEAIAHLIASTVLVVRADAGERPRLDPLTGLLNPTSIDRAVDELVTQLVPFSVATCSIDAFDGYVDTHGHEAGDHALRRFARSLAATVRPDDIVGRSDLDRFTVVFPATSALDAAQALERVRETLVLALSDSELPSFTASFGVTDSNQGTSIDAIMETAELAMESARRAGCNRVVVAGEDPAGEPPDAD